MREIKLGTIGSGPIVHWLLDCVVKTPGICLEAVYSRKQETGEALAAAYGTTKVYTDLDDLFQDKEVNFIYVASPNLLHYEHCRRALLAGKNVICEKPFCARAKEIKALMELAKEKRLYLIDATPTAFLPNLQIIRRELAKIGKVKLVMGNYSQYSSRYDLVLQGERPNIFTRELAAGCLMDINYYNVYLYIALFGKPIDAVYYPNIYDGLADTSGVVIMRHDGFVGQLAGAKDTWGVNYFQIEGEKGYIYVEGGPNGLASVRVVTKSGEEVLNDQPNPNRYSYEIGGIAELVLSEQREELYSRLEVTIQTMEVIEHVRRNAGILFPGDGEV